MKNLKIIDQAQVNEGILQTRLQHPISQIKYQKRYVGAELERYADQFLSKGNEPRMLGLVGLRGTGKTTLLWQIADYIFQSYTQNIYFFNVNTLTSVGISIFEALEYFQTHVIKQRFNTLSKPLVLLFDEIHEDTNWAKTLKILYDEARSVFVVATGSSALLMQNTADLATRMLLKRVFPFSWTEYLTLKMDVSQKNNLTTKAFRNEWKQTLFYSPTVEIAFKKLQDYELEIQNYYANIQNINELVRNYIQFYNIPRISEYTQTADIQQAIEELLKRVIYEDILKLSGGTVSPQYAEKLLLRLSVSDEIRLESLSQSIGIKKEEIEKNIDILTKAELLNVLMPYGGIDTKLNKTKKAFFMSPTLRKALISMVYGENITKEQEARLLEDLVVMYLKQILPESMVSFVSEKNVNVDFVIETMDKPILVEVGLNKTHTRQISKSPIDYRYGIVINSQINDILKKENTIFLPLIWFLLL